MRRLSFSHADVIRPSVRSSIRLESITGLASFCDGCCRTACLQLLSVPSARQCSNPDGCMHMSKEWTMATTYVAVMLDDHPAYAGDEVSEATRMPLTAAAICSTSR